MTTGPDGAAVEELHIRSAQDLFLALRHGDLPARLSLLEAVAAEPEAVLEYGTFGGEDLVDVLRGLIETELDGRVRALTLAALAAIPGERALQAVYREWCLSESDDERLVALARLVGEPDEALAAQLEGILTRDDDPARARMVANHYALVPDLPAHLRLRVAVAADLPAGVPALDAATLDAWLDELRGPFAVQARELLEEQGEAAAGLLSEHWPRLNEEARAWLVASAAREGLESAAGLVVAGLRDGTPAVRLAALEAAAALGPLAAPSNLPSLVALYLASAEPRERLLAVQAGAAIDCAGAATSDPHLPVRLE
ncbi:MAG TPA: hypothetical protein VNT60_04725, partial [Deinococcales bacterium]|nr:hypothetical protein [Deinococcales bacterium]